MSHHDLDEMLRQEWHAPPAPVGLEERVVAAIPRRRPMPWRAILLATAAGVLMALALGPSMVPEPAPRRAAETPVQPKVKPAGQSSLLTPPARLVLPPPPPPDAAVRDPKPRPVVVPRRVEPAADYETLMRESLGLMARGERMVAAAKLRQAAALRPRAHTPHQRLCATLQAAGRPKQALSHCREWLRLETNAKYKVTIRRRIERLEAELRP